MLFGYKEMVDSEIASIVPGADTVQEYDNWIGEISVQSPRKNFTEFTVSKLIDHMFKREFKGYKRSVLVVFHTDAAQRDAFFNEWNILATQQNAARDRQGDMVHQIKEDERLSGINQQKADALAAGTAYSDRTLEEIHGLVEHDPWDNRSEATKEEDKATKKEMDKLRKKGELSEESFGGAKEQREARAAEREKASGKKTESNIRVTDIRTSTDEHGNVTVDNALARKWGGDVDIELKKERDEADALKAASKAKSVYSPEDFAAVLRGDGSSDALSIPPDQDADKRKRQPATKLPSLSAHAEAARKEHQEKQAAIAAEQAALARKQMDEEALSEHSQGIFRGASLHGDQTITVEDLPESIQKAFELNKIVGKSFPLKDYPYNSSIGENAILPNSKDSTGLRIGVYENLQIEGEISMGSSSVLVAKKKDATKPGWCVYVQANKDADPAEEYSPYAVSVVRIR